MIGELIAIVTSVSGVLVAAARTRPRRSRAGVWDVAREAVLAYSQRAMERERRTTLLVLADLTRSRRPDHALEPPEAGRDGA